MIFQTSCETFQLDTGNKTVEENIPILLEKLGTIVKTEFPFINFVFIVLCSQEQILQLNWEYRHKKKVTDVLTWEYDREGFPHEEGLLVPRGEILICNELCHSQAIDNGWDFSVEFFRLVVHGLMHLNGYEHDYPREEKIMLTEESKLLSQLGFYNVYPQFKEAIE